MADVGIASVANFGILEHGSDAAPLDVVESALRFYRIVATEVLVSNFWIFMKMSNSKKRDSYFMFRVLQRRQNFGVIYFCEGLGYVGFASFSF